MREGGGGDKERYVCTWVFVHGVTMLCIGLKTIIHNMYVYMYVRSCIHTVYYIQQGCVGRVC